MPTAISTGPSSSLKMSIDNLRRSLRNLRIFQDFDYTSMLQGNVEPLYTVIRFLLVDYEPLVTNFFVNEKYEILGQSNSRLLESWFKILRQVFNYRPTISIAQFNSRSFMIKKIEIILHFLKQLPELQQRIRRGNFSIKQTPKSNYCLSRRNSLCESYNGSIISNNEKSLLKSLDFQLNPRNRRSRSSSETRHYEDQKVSKDNTSYSFRSCDFSPRNLSRLQSRSHPKLDTTGMSTPKSDEIVNKLRSASSNNMVNNSGPTQNGKGPIEKEIKSTKKVSNNTNPSKDRSNIDMDKLAPLTDMLEQLAKKVDSINSRMMNMEMAVERLSYENELFNANLMHERSNRSTTPSNYFHLLKDNTVTSPKFYTSYEDINNNQYCPSVPLSRSLTKTNYSPLKSSFIEVQNVPNETITNLKNAMNKKNLTQEYNPAKQNVDYLSVAKATKPPLPITSTTNNTTNNNPYPNSLFNNYRHDESSIKSNTDAYQAQVDRISSMLAETQSILEPTIARARKTVSEAE